MSRSIFPHRYSYYIRRGYGLFAIRNRREAKALRKFCEDQLAEMYGTSMYRLNKDRAKVYERTIEMYVTNFETPIENYPESLIKCHCGHCQGEYPSWDFYHYTNDHAGWYWS